MNRSNFYASLRTSGLFPHGLAQSQVNGINALLDAASALAVDETAYVLATAYHETATTMQPIAEYGKGRGRKYGVPGRNHGQVAYGRGFVQTTWDANYERTDKELALGGALVVNYDLLLTDTPMAARAAVQGMVEGWYTGKRLCNYFGSGKCDYVDARRIINGTDKAEKIAGYAVIFARALAS
jgi:predicted chitinase